MIKKLFIFTIILIVLSLSAAYGIDLRPYKLKRFLANYPWSPLQGHEFEIVACADTFKIDYRLYVAIAGAESTYGKRYPRETRNLTGYNSCNTVFASIYNNIYETSKLIGTAKYYEKYRQSEDVKDLIYTYKGVPPYDHYFRNIRFSLDAISDISIEDLRDPIELAIKQWLSVRFDLYKPGKVVVLGPATVLDDFSLDHIDNFLANIGGVVANPLQVSGD